MSNFMIFNPNEEPRNYTINKIIRNSNIVRIIQQLTPYTIFSELVSISKKVLLKKAKREPLDSLFRKELMKKYKIEVQKTSDLLGIDLVEKWGYNKI